MTNEMLPRVLVELDQLAELVRQDKATWLKIWQAKVVELSKALGESPRDIAAQSAARRGAKFNG